MVGREKELATLHGALGRVSSGREFIVLEGEPGIGKSRLLREASTFASELGFDVLHAGAEGLEQARAYGLLLSAVGGRSHPDATDLRDLVARPYPSPADRRLAVIDWFASFIERPDDVPLVLILDDVHWADDETLQVLRAVVRRSAPFPFAIIAATRPAPLNDELERFVDVVEEHGRRIQLDPLDESTVGELVDRLVAESVTPELLARTSSARGNPFFVIEILASGLSGLETTDISRDLRRTVLRRVMHLSDDARTMLRLASLLGTSIDPAELAIVVGRSAIDLVLIVDEAIKGGVLEEREGALVFRHDIVRESVYGDMPTSVRERSHHEVARTLAAVGAPARRVAMHFAHAAQAGDGEAVAWLRRAAAEEIQRSPTAAADMLGQAAELLDRTDPACDEIQAERSQALSWAGRLAEASALATDTLTRLRDPEMAADVRASLGEALFFRGHIAAAGEHLEQAAATATVSQRGLLLAEAALSRVVSGELHLATVLVHRALAEVESTNDPRARSLALGVSSLIGVLSGSGSGLDLARESVRIADEDYLGEAHRYGGRLFLGAALDDADLRDEAIDVAREGIRLDEMRGVSWALPCYHGLLGTLHYSRGEWDDAVAELETAKAVLADTDSTLFGPLNHGLLAQIALHRDDRTGAEQELALGEAQLAKTGLQIGADMLVRTRLMLAEDEGNAEGAAAIVRGAWALAEAMGLRLGLRIFGPAYVRLAVADGDRDAALRAVKAVELLSETTPTRSLLGTARLCRGMFDDDPATLLQAVETLRGAGRPLELAQASEEAAAALTRKGESSHARELLTEAIAIYEGLGAVRDVRRVSEAVGGDGGHRRVAKRRPVSGWGSLSPTELRVVALVAEGLANQVVAETLVVSRRTVETHVSHLFRKLGVTSRVELALLAARELAGAEVQ